MPDSTTDDRTFPGKAWDRFTPEQASMRSDCVARAQEWFATSMDEGRGRLVVVRGGRVVLECNHGMSEDAKPGLASAAKSIYSNILGIVIQEGKLPSADALVVDYYPEMMDVRDGHGNKSGRYAFEANRGITFRHLICNVSGYMKPGEEPGKVFNYQSWGMNILTHALARIYGLWDTADPEGSPGLAVLIQEKLGGPIGADWSYSCYSPAYNDRLQEGARLDIFGYYTGVHTTALDLARLGWLWCNRGRWRGEQVIPEQWMRETTEVAPDIQANCPREEWIYGHGFWTNQQGLLWPNLPTEAFTCSGAGGHYCTVFPGAELVVVQNPGRQIAGDRGAMANPGLLRILLDACD